MDFTELILAGVVETLSEEADAGPYADAIVFQVRDEDDIAALESYGGNLPIIATAEPQSGPGEKERGRKIALLENVADLPPVDAIEVNHEVVANDASARESIQKAPGDVIIAYRNFSETPGQEELSALVKDADQYGDVVYVETLGATMDDALTLLTTIYEAASRGVIIGGACLGEVGRHTRIIAPTYGSRLAYAPVGEEAASGSAGEFPLRELAELIQETEEPTTPVSLSDKITNPMIDDG